MQTTVNKVSDAEYELEITATAEDLTPEIDKALRLQKGKTTMKGFRPGNVPISLVKKVYGKSLAYGVAEHTVQQTFEEQVLKTDEYEVLGQPTITDLTYEYEGDLRAVVKFGVRPEVQLKDFSSTMLYRLKHDVSDEDVDKEIETLLTGRAELVPDNNPASADSVVTVDMQRLDPESRTPIIGEKQEGISVLMSDENILPQLKEALLGASAGDGVNATFPGPEGDPAPRHYQVSVIAVKTRELPEFDDDFVSEVTSERLSSVDQIKAEIRQQLEDGWDRRSNDLFESDVIAKTVELHDIPIPESVVDLYLDSYVHELKHQNNHELPPHFDEAQYREMRREEAAHQATWMFVRDKIIAEQAFEVSDEDRDSYLEKTAGEGMDLETIKQYYKAVPNMQEQLDQRLISEKVFAWIEDQIQIEEKDLESYREITDKQKQPEVSESI